jgi:hypothetical protein
VLSLSIHKGDVGNGEALVIKTQVDVKHHEVPKDVGGTVTSGPDKRPLGHSTWLVRSA